MQVRSAGGAFCGAANKASASSDLVSPYGSCTFRRVSAQSELMKVCRNCVRGVMREISLDQKINYVTSIRHVDELVKSVYSLRLHKERGIVTGLDVAFTQVCLCRVWRELAALSSSRESW